MTLTRWLSAVKGVKVVEKEGFKFVSWLTSHYVIFTYNVQKADLWSSILNLTLPLWSCKGV